MLKQEREATVSRPLELPSKRANVSWRAEGVGVVHEGFIYTREYYSAAKRNEIMPFAETWMDLEIVTWSEVSQTEKDKYHMVSLICGI